MSYNNDYELIRQYLILSTTHQRALNNCYTATINFHRNTTDVVLNYLENSWIRNIRGRHPGSENTRTTRTPMIPNNVEDETINNSSNEQSTQTEPIEEEIPPGEATEEEILPGEATEEETRIVRAQQRITSSAANRRRSVYFYDVPAAQTMERNSRTPSSSVRGPPSRLPPPPPPPPPSSHSLEIPTIPIPPPPPPTSPNGTSIPSPPVPPPPSPPANTLSETPSSTQRHSRTRSYSMLRNRRVFPLPRIRHRRGAISLPSPSLPNLVPTSETELIQTPYDSPVRIRPSMRQIRDGTEILIYSQMGSAVQDVQFRCPIDLLDFVPEDTILRIRQCGHIFREMNLRRHFRRNPRCPLCRFDIRDYSDISGNNITERNRESNMTTRSVQRARAVLEIVNTTLETGLAMAIQHRDLSNNVQERMALRILHNTNNYEE